jgi:hypothetical protein
MLGLIKSAQMVVIKYQGKTKALFNADIRR